MTREISIPLNPQAVVRRTFWTLLIIEAALVLADLFINYGKLLDTPLRWSFNLAREDSLGTFLSSFQSVCVGALLFLFFLDSRAQQERWLSWGTWLTLALCFTLMGIDDTAQFHERVGKLLEDTLANKESSLGALAKYPSYGWQIILLPVLVPVGLTMAYKVWFAFSSFQDRVVAIMGLACFGIAVGLDFLEGAEGGLHAFFGRELDQYTVSHFGKVLEEFLELLGSSLILTAFLSELLSRFKTITFRVI